MTQAAARAERTYGGIAVGERQADRRRRLIEAAIYVYGEAGFKNASVKAVCQTAGLTERYFYEAFPNSEALLVATYDAVNEQYIAMIREAGKGTADVGLRREAMFLAFFLGLKQEPRAAHLFLVEVRGVSPAVDAAITRWLDRFGDLIAETLNAAAADRLLIRGTVGGLLHLAIAWLEAGATAPVERVVAQAFALCAGLQQAATVPGPD